MFDDLLRSVRSGAKCILLIDKHRDEVSDHVDELRASLVAEGFDVAVNANIQSASELGSMVKSKSILSMMKCRREATILFLDAASKKLAFPKKLHVSGNRVLIVYMHTNMQKNPYPKKVFDATFVINGQDKVNVYVEMCSNLVWRQEVKHGALLSARDDDIDDIQHHDLNMVCLILMHNFYACRPSIEQCKRVYDVLVQCEVNATVEDNTYSCLTQAQAMLSLMRSNKHKMKPLEFTQHLSRYSIQSNTKKKLIEKAHQIKTVGHCYEDMLLDDCHDCLSDLREGFVANVEKSFRDLRLR